MKPSKWKPTTKELGQWLRIYKPTGEISVLKNGIVVVRRNK
jgi:hypothetical protein